MNSFQQFNRAIPYLLFVVVTLAFWITRTQLPLTITDTEYVGAFWPLGWRQFLEVLEGTEVARWYRPVETVVIYKMQEWYGENFLPMMLLNSAIAGCIAVLIYMIVTRIRLKNEIDIDRRIIGVAASLIFVFSVPMIETTWLFMHKSVLSDFFLTLGILSYINYINARADDRPSILWIGLLATAGVFAPWTREVAAALPAILGIVTVLRRSLDLRLYAVLLLMSFHALFPTFFTGVIFHQEFFFDSVLERGSSGGASLAGEGSGLLDRIQNPDIPLRLILYLSPLATVLSFASISLAYAAKRERASLIFAAVIGLTLCLAFISIYFQFLVEFIPYVFLIIFAVVSLREFGILLIIWLLVPLAPMYFLQLFDAWLKPSAVPFIVLTLFWIARIPSSVSEFNSSGYRFQIPNPLRAHRTLMAVLVVLILLASTNLIMGSRTFAAAGEVHENIANDLVGSEGNSNAFISNLRQTRDIAYFSEEQVDAYLAYFEQYFPPPGGRDPLVHILPENVDRYDEIFFVINEKFGWTGFGPLDDYLLRDNIAVISNHTTRASYPVLDPFMWGLPEHYVKFGGPSGFLHNFYLNNSPLKGVAEADYTVYKFDGNVQEFSDIILREEILERDGLIQTYLDFNIIGYLDRVVAIPLHEGIFDYRRCGAGEYSICFEGSTLDDVIRDIDTYSLPVIVAEDHFGFTVWRHRESYYAIDVGLPFDERYCVVGGYSLCLTGSSLDEINGAIESRLVPTLARENFRDFNIIAYGRKYFAIPLGEGAFSYERIVGKDFSRLHEGNSLDDLLLDILEDSDDEPIDVVSPDFDYSDILDRDYKGFTVYDRDPGVIAIRLADSVDREEQYYANTISELYNIIDDSLP